MLRIAVITRHFPSSGEPWQGRSTYEALRVLARKTEVRVFYPNAAYPSFLKPRSRIYEKLDAFYMPQDVKVNYYDYPALPLVSRPWNGRTAAHVLLPHVRSFAPDLIFGVFLYPEGYAAVQIGRALSISVVVQAIGSDINAIADPISAMHTRTVLREADFLLTKSDDLCEKAVAIGASRKKTRIVANGCGATVFHVRDRLEARRKLRLDPASEVSIYVGRMNVKKGLRELVEAATMLHPDRANLHVYLIGEGPDRPLIEDSIKAHDAAGYIHVMPKCSFNEVAVWMAAADLVTLPSYMEGCPNVVLEALACGRPVVATRVGGIPEILSDECGRLVPPRDAPALAKALAGVLDSSWDAGAISAHGNRSWETVATELLEIFETLASKRKAPVHAW